VQAEGVEVALPIRLGGAPWLLTHLDHQVRDVCGVRVELGHCVLLSLIAAAAGCRGGRRICSG